jgi:hypothetical protein
VRGMREWSFHGPQRIVGVRALRGAEDDVDYRLDQLVRIVLHMEMEPHDPSLSRTRPIYRTAPSTAVDPSI